MHRFTAKFIPLLLLTFSAVTALPIPIAENDVIFVPVSLSVDIRKDVMHAGGITDEQSEDRGENVEVGGTTKPEPEQSSNEEAESEVGSDKNDKDLRSVEEKVEAEEKDSTKVEVKVETEVEDNDCEDRTEKKVEAEIEDNSCEDKIENKAEPKIKVEIEINSDVKAEGGDVDRCGEEAIKSEVKVEAKVENNCEVEAKDNTKYRDESNKDSDDGTGSCSDDKVEDMCEESCNEDQFEVEIQDKEKDDEFYSECDKQDECDDKQLKDSYHVCLFDEDCEDNNISISSSTCNNAGPDGIQYNSNYNYSCNTQTPHPRHHSPECHDAATNNKVSTSKTQEAKIGKRSAEPKRLPNHLVMYKHMKLAETSPHLLGVKSTDELSEIWAKNLPYPLDGNPTIPGRGHIDKRSPSRDSRIVEQRQKENEIREAYGKHTRPTSGRSAPVRGVDLEQCREDKNALTKELGIGYKLEVGQTEQEKVPEGSERNEQQEINKQQERNEQQELPCGSQRCGDNIERNRDKEQMRVGDAGLLAQLFRSQQSK